MWIRKTPNMDISYALFCVLSRNIYWCAGVFAIIIFIKQSYKTQGLSWVFIKYGRRQVNYFTGLFAYKENLCNSLTFEMMKFTTNKVATKYLFRCCSKVWPWIDQTCWWKMYSCTKWWSYKTKRWNPTCPLWWMWSKSIRICVCQWSHKTNEI